jgi:RES domain-containing protein
VAHLQLRRSRRRRRPALSGALLEILAHLDVEDLPDDIQLIEIDAASEPVPLGTDALPSSWRADAAATRAVGDEWLRSGHSLLLRVPSVIAPRTWNCLVNPRHAEAAALRIVSTERFPFDGRLKRSPSA